MSMIDPGYAHPARDQGTLLPHVLLGIVGVRLEPIVIGEHVVRDVVVVDKVLLVLLDDTWNHCRIACVTPPRI